ncbi:hypothetical protein TTHERM_00047500 (macronuclear) [Tetrahymena thermophila SB210]|uniref:Uncharacterized protein n=1 Tax=Tetrahymena thermophila (strain SB210) TaxID=312017 RepID=Q23DE1_TETTS|nr:hypothetical protein TTHERM_00047500 [Tetrahymena thermophila SB210]EAR94664.2 hypothetical protein TTHERM_00047500 [Tetrahymena thermophila SB210]|eukprot:XP_001014745.2 hypothetical protein TTHERM_00047500 [Tetrahymena thermophila SB210]
MAYPNHISFTQKWKLLDYCQKLYFKIFQQKSLQTLIYNLSFQFHQTGYEKLQIIFSKLIYQIKKYFQNTSSNFFFKLVSNQSSSFFPFILIFNFSNIKNQKQKQNSIICLIIIDQQTTYQKRFHLKNKNILNQINQIQKRKNKLKRTYINQLQIAQNMKNNK